MLLGLGWPEWLTIAGLVGALILTFWVMAKGQMAYEKARRAKEQGQAGRQQERGQQKRGKEQA